MKKTFITDDELIAAMRRSTTFSKKSIDRMIGYGCPFKEENGHYVFHVEELIDWMKKSYSPNLGRILKAWNIMHNN